MMLINGDCFDHLVNINSDSIDLILVDPPYAISKKSSFTKHSQNASKDMITKYNLSIDFGEWDKQEIDLDRLFYEYYRVLKKGGTLIIFYDIWKSSKLKFFAEKYNFNQSRVGQWQKTNPVPINSKVNYLSNAIEFFFSFVKEKNPTFNSKYDNGVYTYPLCHGNERTLHPTQKPLNLIKDLVEKHSNVGDLVLDTFAGSGTTAEACILLNRNYVLMEKDKNYFEIIKNRIDKLSTKSNIDNI